MFPRTLCSLAASALITTAITSSASAQVFQGLGFLAGGTAVSGAQRVSRDGSTVVGYAGIEGSYVAFRWRQSTGMISVGDFAGGHPDGSVASSANVDGSVVVGFGTNDFQYATAFRWTQSTGLVSLDDIDAEPNTTSFSNDVSDDGMVVAIQAGFRGNGPGMFVGEAARWTLASGLTPLGHLPGGDYSFSNAVSADGSVIVGGSTVTGGGYHTFRWTQATGMVSLGDVPGGEEFSYAQDISSDGTIVVGSCANETGRFAMRWTQATGMISLGGLPGGGRAGFDSAASAVSDDGNTIVGIANFTGTFGYDTDAFIWTPQRGMRYLKDAIMADYCAPELEGWRLVSAWGISGNGRVIVGEGVNPQGNSEAYIIRLDSGPCRADFNQDNFVNSQDFFDFLAAFFAGC